MTRHSRTDAQGGCLCGTLRYRVSEEPVRVTYCHCTFCQRFTGSAFLVEPVFRRTAVTLTRGQTRTYDHTSDESGGRVTLHFCERCSTTLFLEIARYPETYGLCAGTFDDPNWFERTPSNSRHVFTRSSQKGIALPAGVPIYHSRSLNLDGTANPPLVYAHAVMARREQS